MKKIEISHKTIIFIAVFIFFIWAFIQIRDIVFLLFVAFILMAGLRPGVDALERVKIPRPLAILILYILLFVVLTIASGIVLPPLIAESTNFTNNLGTFFEKSIPFLQLNIQSIVNQVGPISQNVLKVTIGVFTNVLTLFTLLVFTFYLLLERKNLTQFLHELVGDGAGLRVQQVIVQIEYRIGAWIRGQLTLMLLIGVIVYLGLTILRIPYALPLAIIAGFLEVLPIIGPNVAGLIAIIVALSTADTPLVAVAVGAFYFIVQQLENSVIVPMVMRKTVGLPPLITIIALLIGGKLAGMTGVILSVPLVLVIQTIAQDVWPSKVKSTNSLSQ